MNKENMNSTELKQFLEEGLESGRIKEGGFISEAIATHIELLEEEEKKENKE